MSAVARNPKLVDARISRDQLGRRPIRFARATRIPECELPRRQRLGRTRFGDFLPWTPLPEGRFRLPSQSQNRRQTPSASFNFNARGTAIPNEPYSGNQIGYSFASYLLGIVDSAGLADPLGLGGRCNYMALYLQDDFKFSRTLTFNIGLCWEYQPPVYEVADRLSSWNPEKIDPVSGLRGAYDFAGT